MSHEDFKSTQEELDALRERFPVIVEEAVPTPAKYSVPYTLDLGRQVVDFYARGISLHAVAQKAGMPTYSTLLRWAKEHPELSKMLRAVREARALHFEDMAIEAAENAQGKDADRLKVDTYIWAAGVNDPATYGKKVTHSGDTQNPVVIQVVTGFGPPNEWQTPPKLKADGTIDKATPVENEVVNGTEGTAPQAPGSEHSPSGSSPVRVDGHAALSTVNGHTASNGSAQGPPLRRGKRKVSGKQDAPAGTAPQGE